MITGHSLGAALSFLMALDMIVNLHHHGSSKSTVKGQTTSPILKRRIERGRARRANLLQNMYLYVDNDHIMSLSDYDALTL